ncbi:MAG: hypothetical protein PSY14_17290 [bacterium]|nr:hypothetical protein [bacterium]
MSCNNFSLDLKGGEQYDYNNDGILPSTDVVRSATLTGITEASVNTAINELYGVTNNGGLGTFSVLMDHFKSFVHPNGLATPTLKIIVTDSNTGSDVFSVLPGPPPEMKIYLSTQMFNNQTSIQVDTNQDGILDDVKPYTLEAAFAHEMVHVAQFLNWYAQQGSLQEFNANFALLSDQKHKDFWEEQATDITDDIMHQADPSYGARNDYNNKFGEPYSPDRLGEPKKGAFLNLGNNSGEIHCHDPSDAERRRLTTHIYIATRQTRWSKARLRAQIPSSPALPIRLPQTSKT